ncbi:hypothetical protein ACNOYE_00875 [Nannocystaceae bacterium ST9]
MRPHTRALPLALIALALGLLVPASLDAPAAWLGRALARAFDSTTNGPSGPPTLPSPGLALALAIGSLLAVAALHALASPKVPLRPAIDARRVELPIALRIALAGLGLLLALWLLAPIVAAAARSVDASPASLAELWLAWLRRALLTLAGCAGLLAALEWIASARRLWLALHLDDDRARELRQTRGR